MKDLSTIQNFGGIDADNDGLLMECFENHKAYIDALNFKKNIIVGRKGSGKTAIYKKFLLGKSHDIFTFGHSFSDYPWDYHDKQVKLGIPDFDKYTHSWKYLILLTISKIILNRDLSIPYDPETLDYIAKIESFIVDTYGTRDPDVTQIFTPSKILKLRPSIEINFELLKAGISPESIPMSELPTIIQEVNTNLLDYILKSLNPVNKYYILFDQLDLGFDPKNADYNNRLIGLLLASKDLINKAKEYKQNLNVIIFLRDDIYDNLHFDDKNKITENLTSTIEWDTPRTSNTLKSLMEKRFTELLKNGDSKIIWENIFDETHQMTGRQSKYQYIIDRTFLRPRDIIKFCNEVLIQYKRRIQNNANEPTKFDNKDINASKLEYSNYFLNELDDEIFKHIPYYKDAIEIFKKMGYLQFKKEDFINTLKENTDLFKHEIEPIEILKKLFEFSIIGFYKAGGSGYGGSEYVFKYKDVRSTFDINADTYKIHPGLMEVLQLRRSIRGTTETSNSGDEPEGTDNE